MGAFSSLIEKFQMAFTKLTRKGRLSESDILEVLKEVQIALLEADVNFKIVKELINRIREKAIGKEVLESLTPGQHVIDIVNKELIEVLGGIQKGFLITNKKPFIILLIGLQGSGKTTTAAKLVYLLKSQNKKSFLIAADIYRPAAIDQLRILADKVSAPIHYNYNSKEVLAIVGSGLEEWKKYSTDVIIIDTAGRTHLDNNMMTELIKIKDLVSPNETILVVDGMIGQDAVNIGKEFNEKVGIDSLAVTKMDGDSRGGAIISLKAVTGKPIKLIGMGEKIDQLELFYPDRIAGRILGMGDVLTLIEKTKNQIDNKEAIEMQKKLMKATFTFEDFLSQIKQIRNLGSLEDVLSMLPGGNKLKSISLDRKDIGKIEAMIFSMTVEERQRPNIIDAGRKKRIAKGSGTRVQDINKLLKQFDSTRQMMKQFGTMSKNKKGLFPKFLTF